MCGIFGMIGQNAVKTTLDSLRYLEYRGYDSAGIAVKRKEGLEWTKCMGRISELQKKAQGMAESDIAIGHTRWATHGRVCEQNAHPFVSEDGAFAIVHNGILENYLELKKELPNVHFSSQTDSETVAHMLSAVYRGDVLEAVLAVAKKLQGSFAIAIMSVYDNKLYAVKNKSPLVVGVSRNGTYLCSDVGCASRQAEQVALAEDNTVAVLSDKGVRFFDFDGQERRAKFFVAEQSAELQTEEGDVMLKEIFEIPQKIRASRQGYLQSGGLRLSDEEARRLKRIYLVGCGTAYNSGSQVACVARNFLDIDILPVIASEFIYDNYPVGEDTLAFLISQSGETADTLRAAEKIRHSGGITYAVTNNACGSLGFLCDYVSNVCAGAEFAVASTKAYNCQLVTLTLLLADIAVSRKTLSVQVRKDILCGLEEVAVASEQLLTDVYPLVRLAEELKKCSAVFYIGRLSDYPTACEGSLKLKEISYIHSEAYPAGELKHGTLALMEEGVAVIALATDEAMAGKIAYSVTEVVSRGARVISVGHAFPEAENIPLPKVHPYLADIISVIPLQLLAYYTAKSLSRDVDKPRNLAKSVTVE